MLLEMLKQSETLLVRSRLVNGGFEVDWMLYILIAEWGFSSGRANAVMKKKNKRDFVCLCPPIEVSIEILTLQNHLV